MLRGGLARKWCIALVPTEDEVQTTVVVQVNASSTMTGTVSPDQFAEAVAATAGDGAEVQISV